MEENSPHKIYGAIRIIYRPNFLGLWNICNNFWLKHKNIVVRVWYLIMLQRCTTIQGILPFLWKPINCAQVNFIKNLEEEWLLGNNFLFLLHKVRKHESKGNGKYISSVFFITKVLSWFRSYWQWKVKIFELHFIIPTLVSNKIHICIQNWQFSTNIGF